jgi:hypothetical protein
MLSLLTIGPKRETGQTISAFIYERVYSHPLSDNTTWTLATQDD